MRRATTITAADVSRGDPVDFLRALGRRMSLRLLVYVGVDAPARAQWLSPETGPPGEIATLEELGRTWLRAALRGEPPPLDVALVEHAFITAVESRNGGGPLGAVVLGKEAGEAWTGYERAVVRFAIRYYAPQLDPRADAVPVDLAERGWQVGPDLATELRDALGAGELNLVFQPEFDLDTDEIVAVEALLRWTRPSLGEVPPETIVSVAERTGVLGELGAWVFERAIATLGWWRASIPGLDLEIRINAAPAQLRENESVGALARALATYDVPGAAVCVELTETTRASDPDVVRTLRALATLGVRSAIDDLAAGYSSLGRLRAVPVDVVKIDRSLVTGVHDDPRGRTILAAVRSLSDALGIEAVAEGVENDDDLAALREMGFRRAQGHALGRPVGAEEMAEILAVSGRRRPSK